jgi:hypothetical protein
MLYANRLMGFVTLTSASAKLASVGSVDVLQVFILANVRAGGRSSALPQEEMGSITENIYTQQKRYLNLNSR